MGDVICLDFDKLSDLNGCPNLKLFHFFKDCYTFLPLISFGLDEEEFEKMSENFNKNAQVFLERAYIKGELEPQFKDED